MLELKYIDNAVIEANTIYDYYIPVIIKKEMYSIMYVEKMQTYLSNGKMEIVLDDIKSPLKEIKITDKFEIGVNDKLQIVYFVVKKIPQNEYELLLETLQKP